jgi:serine acetyltransferase
VAFDILDLVWRDFDRMARAGANPLQLLADPASWVVAAHRIGRVLHALPAALRAPLLFAYRPWEVALGAFAGMSLPVDAEIGGGLRLGCVGGIHVAEDAYIGRDCDLSEGVTIASCGGAPWIGDRVLIGPGAKLRGPIRVGNDVAIEPNAVVECDVPDGTTVAGVPARIVAGEGSRGRLVPGRKRPPLLDAMRGVMRGLLPRPTQLLLRG